MRGLAYRIREGKYSFDSDLLIFEILAVVFATEVEGVCLRRKAVHYAGNNVGAARPVCLCQVGL